MKSYEIDFKFIFSSLYKQWKTLLASIVLFLVAGIAFGIYIYNAGDEVYENLVSEIPLIQCDTKDTFSEIENKKYIISNLTRNLYDEVTLDDEQRAQVLELKIKFESFDEEVLQPYICELGLLSDIQNNNLQYLFKGEEEIIVAIEHKIQETTLEVCDELNSYINQANTMAKQIAEDNNLSIKVDANKDQPEVKIAHGHRLNSARERAETIVLFCALSGVCLGAFFAMCKEAKRTKKSLEEAEASR